jgi:hypothetical protein
MEDYPQMKGNEGIVGGKYSLNKSPGQQLRLSGIDLTVTANAWRLTSRAPGLSILRNFLEETGNDYITGDVF